MKYLIIGFGFLVLVVVVVMAGAQGIGFLLAHFIGGDRQMYASIIITILLIVLAVSGFLLETKGHSIKTALEFIGGLCVLLSPFILSIIGILIYKAIGISISKTIIFFQR